MIKRIHHIGIAVEDLEEAQGFFEKHFKMSVSGQESFGELQFAFTGLQETDLELLQSTTSDGVIAKFIDRKGAGVHHITFEVDDIEAELVRLKDEGLKLINEKPYRNAHNDLVAFIHPKSSYGILLELIQPGAA